MDKGILELESKIGVEEGFFENLIHEDDWSFIIKLHALFEAACTHLLLFHFNEPGLSKILSRLELSNNTTGKLTFLKETELLGKNDRKFISCLSEIRNSLVHDIRKTKFSLNELVNSFDSKKLTSFTKTFSPFAVRVIEIQEGKSPLTKGKKNTLNLPSKFTFEMLRKQALENPKEHIWNGAHNVLVSIVDMYSYSEFKQWEKAKIIMFEDEA